ncbi:hypothetical protein AGMMS49938_16840 [Fibrobacterales bacterium]|nr:hypothetical protein AGMMS49938_16840 [Fibrobacterales bacterium]
MKQLFLILFLLATATFAQQKNNAQQNNTPKNNAIGLWLQGGNSGEYWGLDYKNLGTDVITDIYLHLSASNNNFSLGLYGGYYFVNNAIKADASAGKFPIHYGPTAGFGYWNDGGTDQHNFNGFAVRAGVVGGISWILPVAFPMDISVELNPVAEYQHTSWEDGYGEKQSGNSWEIPNLYFRILFHAYVF